MFNIVRKKEVGKHLLARKVEECKGKTLTIAHKIQYSPNHIHLYAGEKGKAIAFDIGDGEADEMIVQLELVQEKGKGTKKKKVKQDIWVHALDILDFG